MLCFFHPKICPEKLFESLRSKRRPKIDFWMKYLQDLDGFTDAKTYEAFQSSNPQMV